MAFEVPGSGCLLSVKPLCPPFVLRVCVLIAIPAIFLARSCVVVFTAAVSLNLAPVNGKRWQTQKKKVVKCGWKSFLQKGSPLMVGRSGTVAAVRRRPCGQDRKVKCVKQTFRRRCKADTNKLFRTPVVEAGRNRQHLGSVRTKFRHTRPSGQHRQSCVNCVKKSGGMKEKGGNSGRRENRLAREAGLKSMRRWRWMKKLIARTSWISERKSCGSTIAKNQ